MVLFIGFTHNDTKSDVDYLINKIINLRIFEDDNNLLNKNIIQVKGQILSISQFTLYGNVKKGTRPDFKEAMNFDEAKKLYHYFNDQLRINSGLLIEEGVFGADMEVHIINDGPCTIMLESRKI